MKSGPVPRPARPGQGSPYLKGVLGEAAAAAAKTDTFLGVCYRGLVKRRGKLKALVAVAHSILTIVWHLLADQPPATTSSEPITTPAGDDLARRTRNHVRQLEALGYRVTLAA